MTLRSLWSRHSRITCDGWEGRGCTHLVPNEDQTNATKAVAPEMMQRFEEAYRQPPLAPAVEDQQETSCPTSYRGEQGANYTPVRPDERQINA